ncbi:Predicted amidohydrolase [Nitratireductor aquibiodomus]|uniref:Predicted amidohydrolase n=1 Tax=Nitratireductor aquibiodomus TaxID=204799 RepID=A0A1H4KGT3_9HYPH|nr:N-carbamoyl-D-amino-acid hydrolase [Nitratireductor aquibiodomus]SEB57456.1 Predicted amidohydrolase [Nitratireductor aquibiodomus]
MTRRIKVGGAQMGPITKADGKPAIVARLVALLRQAGERGCELVVFPELTLSTFFPRWYAPERDGMDHYFDRAMPGPETQLLFDEAKRLGIGFCLGYAELVEEEGRLRRFNTSILVDRAGALVGKYRKIHLPGHAEYEPQRSHQHLEKRYFEVGNTGFQVWEAFGGTVGMAICNDRRWVETYRVMGLQNVELIMIGYNTPVSDSLSGETETLRMFHNHLTMQAGAYQNSTWVVGVAKAGVEDGHRLMGGSVIVAPTGEIVAAAETEGDELIVADCDLDRCEYYKSHIFNFAAHRRPEFYGRITAQKGVAKGPRST